MGMDIAFTRAKKKTLEFNHNLETISLGGFHMLYPVFHYATLDNALNELLNNNRAARVQTTTPAINVKENQSGYEIELAAPGMTKDDFHVNVDKDGVLNIKMEHKDENEQETNAVRYLRREFSYANFEQRLQLPDDVDRDKIMARVEDGVLRIGLPRKTEKEEITKNIEVA